MKSVWILTKEENTGDSEHDTEIVDVFETEASGLRAQMAAEADARELGKAIYGDNERQFDDWDVDFNLEEHEVKK